MKFSVVIPMYNNSQTIVRCLTSVFNQTRIDAIDEIIIVDDGSTDNSTEIINNQFPNKLIKIIKKKNGGAASARNVGIRQARNDYIALLDADDEWHPDKMEIQSRILENHKYIKALGSNRTGENIQIGKKIDNKIYKLSSLQYCLKNWPCTPSLVFDKKVFQNEDYFPEDMDHAEEGLFFLYLSNHTGLYYVSDELVTCGGGKRAFGVSGLSGNIRLMHDGNMQMILRAGELGYVPRDLVWILRLYERLKYIRRLFIVKFNT